MDVHAFSPSLFADLERINHRPKPFQFYTASELWTDDHTSRQMLAFHLNEDLDVASRKTSFIDKSVAWLVSRFGLDHGRRVIDFGCGPGLYTSRLAKLGAVVTGIDFSARSIRHRKESSTYAKNLMDGFWSPHPYYGFLNVVKYESEKVVLDKYTIVEEQRTREVYNWLQYFSVETIEREFDTAGLEIEEVLSNVAGDPFDAEDLEFAVVALGT